MMDQEMEEKTSKMEEPKRVYLFSASRRLIAIVCSGREAAALLSGGLSGKGSCSPANVSNAALGKQKTAKGYYVRYEHPDVEVEMSDIGELSVEEFDRLCGIEREYISSRFLPRKRVIRFKNAGHEYI